MAFGTAGIVTVGSELTSGLRVDTNTAEIARALTSRGFDVAEAVSVGDDASLLADELARLCATRDLVVTTGGLGPTHDDITRQAAASALGVALEPDARLVELLRPIQARHTDPDAVGRILVQAEVLPGSQVIDFSTGTAPGLIVETGRATLCLLPGPPSEMRPMLRELLERFESTRAEPQQLGVVGLSESDAQMQVLRAIASCRGVGFTILAKPGDVRVILTDEGAGEASLVDAADRAQLALGDYCYADDSSTLAETVVRLATQRDKRIALAESCTGGMVAAALTDVPGSSAAFLGSIVSYANSAKTDILGISNDVIEAHGAVSREVVELMAEGASKIFSTPDVSIAISGVAGPGGGAQDKPVGTVWFALQTSNGVRSAFVRHYQNASREAVRARATSCALDAIRRVIQGLELPR